MSGTDTLSTLELLRNFRIFDHFGADALERLVSLSTSEEVAEATHVFSRGDASSRLYLVLRGAFRLQRSSNYGHLTLAHILPGDLFGEVGYIDGKESDADAVAETDSEILVFDFAKLGAEADSDPLFATALTWTLWKSLAGKLRRANTRLAGFFGKEGSPPQEEGLLPATATGEDFRVSLDAKKALFNEQQLSSLEVNLLATMSQERQLEPGEAIFRENDTADSLYVVLSGSVMISKYIPGAGDEALAFLGRGDYFGEMALLDGQKRSAGAEAHEDGAAILSIPREVVLRLLDIEKVSSLRLLGLFCKMVALRLRKSDEKLFGWFLLSAGQAPP